MWNLLQKEIRFTDASGPGHLLKMICQNRSTVTSDLRVRRQFFTLWSMIFEVFLAELVILQHDFCFHLIDKVVDTPTYLFNLYVLQFS